MAGPGTGLALPGHSDAGGPGAERPPLSLVSGEGAAADGESPLGTEQAPAAISREGGGA